MLNNKNYQKFDNCSDIYILQSTNLGRSNVPKKIDHKLPIASKVPPNMHQTIDNSKEEWAKYKSYIP